MIECAGRSLNHYCCATWGKLLHLPDRVLLSMKQTSPAFPDGGEEEMMSYVQHTLYMAASN